MAQTVESVLNTLDRSAAERDTVSLDDVLETFGPRAQGPLVFAIGLVMLSPVNWIPGAGIVLATALTLFLSQALLRSGPPRLPRRVGRAEISSDRARQAIAAVRPWARRASVLVQPRLRTFTTDVWRRMAMVMIIITALSMYPLAIIPGGAGPPSLAIAVFGLALLAEDGALMLVALGMSLGALGFAVWTFG
ncbi:exopolysaccharide biosynthesis protein [Rhodospira trueperi]|uniref:Uncharacterized conserved protein n=1 Tax=Rhodospira trueperi TaxID=69960 RepID=A0A1G7DC94_9PROT|nr:exopolysaccharide biosynthesis protein [Rhodospira trueperi]SDE48385.1 Uncharacterized conserved protein [Rhodospira trueperi]